MKLEQKAEAALSERTKGPAPAVEADAARLAAIENACHSGVIKLNDYLGAVTQYIYWGGNGGKTLREAIDAALAERTKGTT